MEVKLFMLRNAFYLLISLPLSAFCQEKTYFQQQVDYVIDVTLDPDAKTLNGDVSLRYVNNSPDTLHYIWFHLWPNAYKNDRTAFSEQLLRIGQTDFYFSDESERGYINRVNFSVDGTTAVLEDHPQDIDIAKLILPTPLPPGRSVHIQTPFHEKLPYLFSRGGYADDLFMITQWYPKPAVYDRQGWHPMPYLDQGEFYGEFGNYEVHMTVPGDYHIASTGRRTNVEHTGNMSTYTYTQEDVHDFAWFAGTDMRTDSSEMQSISGRTIQLLSCYRKKDSAVWKNSIDFAREAIKNREADLGAYGYASITVVEAPDVFTGGMEYPTIAVIGPVDDEQALNELINHEVGHNWTYAMLASNERDYPWMDEGMTSFYTDRFIRRKYRRNILTTKKDFIEKRLPEDFDNFLYRYQIAQRRDQPIGLPSQDFSPDNYYASIYYKAPVWMQQLRDYLGADVFGEAMHTYFDEWKFRHPYPEDFQKVIERVSGRNVDSLFHLLDTKGDIIPRSAKKTKVQSFFDFSHTDKYNYILLSPVPGFNVYDGFMVGAAVHNYTLPLPPLHFFLSPMVGTRNGKLNGMGRVEYSKMSYGKIRKLDISVAASKFDMRRYIDPEGGKNYMDYYKIVPAVRLTFRNKSPLSEAKSYLQWKTYLINETALSFVRDVVRDTLIATFPRAGRYLNELIYHHENNRVLYPFSYELTGQQGDGFLRATVEVRQFYNYPGGGGLNARLFGGKLFYINQTIPKSAFSRYQLNMTGPNGAEDYTYSDYFLGRREFSGLPSQQIMIRDGGFKARTDLLNRKVGISDDWLTAVNLDTDIPFLMPISDASNRMITIKAFGDAGTHAGVWNKEAPTGKFLFDAGLQINLLKDLIKVYVPLFYSRVYRDYYKFTIPQEQRFWKKISFSIDIRQFNLRRFLDIPY